MHIFFEYHGRLYVARRFRVTAIPTTYVIDREGNLFKKYVGQGKKKYSRTISNDW